MFQDVGVELRPLLNMGFHLWASKADGQPLELDIQHPVLADAAVLGTRKKTIHARLRQQEMMQLDTLSFFFPLV